MNPDRAARVTSRVVQRRPVRGEAELDAIAIEEPLELRLQGTSVVVTMRTPGDDLDLATGFFRTEGFIRDASDLAALGQGDTANIVEGTLVLRAAATFESSPRNFYASSACGICGKAAIEHVFRNAPQVKSSLKVTTAFLNALPATMRTAQEAFDATGGTHAAGLFDAAGKLVVLREDVGRHNAVDKVVGSVLRGGSADFSGFVLLVSGRAGFEILQKAGVAGIPIVAAVGAPSSLAVDAATKMGVTLVGFLRNAGFSIYAGAERIE